MATYRSMSIYQNHFVRNRNCRTMPPQCLHHPLGQLLGGGLAMAMGGVLWHICAYTYLQMKFHQFEFELLEK